MDSLHWWAYLHILLMVFWIGTDIGVFLAGLRFIDSARSVAERSAIISLGMVIDRFPRVCFVLMMPVGFQLVYLQGLLPVPHGVLMLVWIASLVWLTAVVTAMVCGGTPKARPWKMLDIACQIAGVVAFGALAVAGYTGRLPMPGWLLGKLALYGAICLFALALELSFAPVFVAFGAIVAAGSTPQREGVLKRHMLRSYVWVIAIYAAVLSSGFLGTAKP